MSGLRPVPRRWLEHLGFGGAALVLCTTLLAAVPREGAPPGSGTLAGQLLVASPEIGDPRFQHAVVLMVQHDARGAFGLIINRPVAERSLASLLDALGLDSAGAQGSIRIYAGGPVEPDKGFVLHDAAYHRPETLEIDGRIAMTASPEVLRDIAEKRGPAEHLLAFGYSGWDAGQIEAEMAHHDWFTEPEDPKLVFEEDRERLWEEALARRSREL